MVLAHNSERHPRRTAPLSPLFLLRTLVVLLFLSGIFFFSFNMEKMIMFHIYHSLNREIRNATSGTHIPPSYLAALISLESQPPGNRDSQRFESSVYRRLLRLKREGRPFGKIPRSSVQNLSDQKLRELATSYGLTQIMGYHCLDLGCTIDQLKGPDHLIWAVRYIQIHYGRMAEQKRWSTCFRIHNTGHPRGEPVRKDYVEKGLMRMKYYRKWMERKGNLF